MSDANHSNHGFSAVVVEDSIAPHGGRLTTLQLRYPRFIHAEFMTHRVFSRNASSSRAIPVAKMLKQVRNEPAMPIHWGKNQPGMQAREEFTGNDREMVIADWMAAAEAAAIVAERMNRYGAHKQVVNRILEPFQFISVIVTATEWANFFELRDHEDAQPEIRLLAQLMREAMDRSDPMPRQFDRHLAVNWHLPYITYGELTAHARDPRYLAKLSAARCARVSYLTHEGKEPDAAEDLKLYERLVGSRPLHASPIEHQGYALLYLGDRSRNFWGWMQHRELVETLASLEE